MSNRRVQLLIFFSFVFLIPIFLLGFFIFFANASEAGHLAISAIQITEGEGKTNHDFIEIYNPTAQDINLKGYRLVKRTKAGTSDTSIKSWTDDVIIKAHGWRLWASSDDAAFPASLGADDFTKQTIAADNGIAIRFGAADTGEIIDSVAWGAAENIFKEGNIPANPAASEALVRKPGNENGNREDTNDNTNDFNIASSFIPRNSSNPVWPAVETVSDNNSGIGSGSGGSEDVSLPSPSPASVSQGNAPVAEAGNDKIAVIGQMLNFDGSDSFDTNDRELGYIWDFGDGKIAKGENVQHAYSAIGEFTVVLKVSNGIAASDDLLKVKISKPQLSDKIILNEILPDPSGSDKDGEWIELANLGDEKVNLLGWVLDDIVTDGGKPYVFQKDVFIEPQDFLIIKRTESKLVLPNTGGEINLLWYNEKLVSKVSYGKAKEGKSYAFINNAWQWSDSSTPGKENSEEAIAPTNSKENGGKISWGGLSASSGAQREAAWENFDDENGNIVPALNKAYGGKNTALLAAADYDFENYIDELIAEEVESAIVKALGKDLALQENISTSDNNGEVKGVSVESGNFSGNDPRSAEGQDSDSGKTRDNPWFWGDMALSVMSLFLVWRYQNLKKKVK